MHTRNKTNSFSTKSCLLLISLWLQMPTMLCLPPKLDLPAISSDEIQQVWGNSNYIGSETKMQTPAAIKDDQTDEYYRFGLSGHAGLFQALDWTLEELKHISLWHAQADYQKCVDLVEKKLAHSQYVNPVTRGVLQNFIEKFRPPQVVKDLLTYKEKHQVKNYHLAKNVDRILEIIGNRISELDDVSRAQVINYLGSVIQATSSGSLSSEAMSLSAEDFDESAEQQND